MDQPRFQDLAARARAGEREAIGALLVAGFEPIRTTIAAGMDDVLIKGGVEPEDIVQEAYAAAWPRMSGMQFDRFDAFLAWLRTIAENKAIDTRRGLLAEKRDVRRNLNRSANSGQSYADLLAQLAAAGSTPSRKVARQEAVALTMVQMAQLPQHYRQVIQWRVIQGLSVPEVATLLGRSEDAVHMLCYRALKKLGELIGESSNYLIE